jgi:hypothetical protein
MNVMTPADWAILQQWDAARRALMLLHPGFGLSQAGLVLESWNPGHRYGWNRMVRDEHAQHKEVYTYFGRDGAQTTTDAPRVPPRSIHTTTSQPPDLQTSQLWSILKELGKQVASKNLIPNAATEVPRVENAIEYFARDLRHLGLMHARARAALVQMREAMSASKGGAVKAADFFQPIYELVDDYLSFKLPGMIASEVLAVLLSSQSTVPPLGPPEFAPPQARSRAAEHLANVAYELQAARGKKDLLSYYQLTYLAGLYTRTVGLLTNWAKQPARHADADLEALKKLNLNVDELFAHKIGPTYALPGLFEPYRLLGWLEEGPTEQHTAQDDAHYWQVHPALRDLLDTAPTARTPTNVIASFKSASDKAETVDIEKAIRSTARPIADKNAEDIHLVLLTMSLGRGA